MDNITTSEYVVKTKALVLCIAEGHDYYERDTSGNLECRECGNIEVWQQRSITPTTHNGEFELRIDAQFSNGYRVESYRISNCDLFGVCDNHATGGVC